MLLPRWENPSAVPASVSNLEEIIQSQTETTDALTRVRQKAAFPFSGIRSISDSLKRLEIGSSLSIPASVCQFPADCSCQSQGLTAVTRIPDFPDDSLEEMFKALEPLTPLNTEIKRCILSEDEVSDDASPGLRHVRRQMRGIGDRIHTQLIPF